MNRVITTMVSGDPKHIDMLKVFLLSLKKTGCWIDVIAYIVNGVKNDGLFWLYDNLLIRDVLVSDPTPIKVLYTRPKQMADCLKEDFDQVASIDADIIFRKPIDGIWDGVVSNSVKFWDKGEKARLNNRFQGGVFVIGNGVVAKEYWNGVVTGIPENPDGYCSQRLMFTETQKRKGLTIIPLSTKYNDCEFKDESVMWHGKSGHRNDPKLIAVFNDYLKRANSIIQR